MNAACSSDRYQRKSFMKNGIHVIAICSRNSTFASNGTSTSTVTLAAPAGVVAGDVEIAQLSIPGSVSVSSVPLGWSLVRSDTTGATFNDLGQNVYSHVAATGEPLRYTWGLSQATVASAGLSAWTGNGIARRLMICL